MEEEKEKTYLPDINRIHKTSKFIFKRKTKVKLNPEIVKDRLNAIDMRKSIKSRNFDCSKSNISIKESGLSSEIRYE